MSARPRSRAAFAASAAGGGAASFVVEGGGTTIGGRGLDGGSGMATVNVHTGTPPVAGSPRAWPFEPRGATPRRGPSRYGSQLDPVPSEGWLSRFVWARVKAP